MEPLNHLRRWNTYSTDKQLGAAINDDVHQFIQLAACVIMVCLTCVAANLRKCQVDSER
jgi:hypothetical protein